MDRFIQFIFISGNFHFYNFDFYPKTLDGGQIPAHAHAYNHIPLPLQMSTLFLVMPLTRKVQHSLYIEAYAIYICYLDKKHDVCSDI